MKKTLLLVLCCLPLLGTTCPVLSTDVPSIGVTCSNNLDASSFGFKLTIPTDFQCTTTRPNSNLVVSVRYKKASNSNIIAAVTLGPSGDVNTNCGTGATCVELDPVTTAKGITFRRIKVTGSNPVFISYLAVTTLPSGRNLGITVSAVPPATDDGSLLTTLGTILETVQLVP